MEPYYILKTKTYTTVPRLSSAQQLALGERDDQPIVELKLITEPLIEGYDKYKMTSENIEKITGRAYGRNDEFEQFISIRYSDVYYSTNTSCLYFHSKKSLFNQFEKTFNKSVELTYNKVNIDFKNIIDNQNALDIKGIWFGNLLDTNVKSLLLMGNKVEESSKYQDLLTEGTVTNITLIYNYNGKNLKIMITKDGGIIFYDKINETDALTALDYIYMNLITPAMTSVS
ncbi:hypothetical protein [Clostridium sp.]|uniref:hypothetical protein n=1 Tax=Clostridium sp. TaxID=1506 RepID=UPI001D3A09B3|nr:hypothetical protein [Clostridium sp.]MBS5986462.1 hypothetical protein [Clostridium sp.]